MTDYKKWVRIAGTMYSESDSDSSDTYSTGYESGASDDAESGWGTASPPPEAVAAAPPPSTDVECWLGDEQEDLGRVASVFDRLYQIGWLEDAFEKAAEEGDDTKFHEVLGRAAEAARALSPYDPTCQSFWVRVDGWGFTKWSDAYAVVRPYDNDVHGAFVRATR